MVNIISKLIDDNNNKLVKLSDVQTEIVQFYSSLLGSCAPHPPIDIPTMRSGLQLSYEDKSFLCCPVTNAEIYLALKGIGDCRHLVLMG